MTQFSRVFLNSIQILVRIGNLDTVSVLCHLLPLNTVFVFLFDEPDPFKDVCYVVDTSLLFHV